MPQGCDPRFRPANPKADALRAAGEKGAWAGWVPDLSAYGEKKLVSNAPPKASLPAGNAHESNRILLEQAEVGTPLWMNVGEGDSRIWVLALAPLRMSAKMLENDEDGTAFVFDPNRKSPGYASLEKNRRQSRIPSRKPLWQSPEGHQGSNHQQGIREIVAIRETPVGQRRCRSARECLDHGTGTRRHHHRQYRSKRGVHSSQNVLGSTPVTREGEWTTSRAARRSGGLSALAARAGEAGFFLQLRGAARLGFQGVAESDGQDSGGDRWPPRP